jgi:hypothetical protein
MLLFLRGSHPALSADDEASPLADSVKDPLICDRIRHEASSPHVLKDTGIKKLSVFAGTWRAWSADSAGKGKISAVSTCQFSPNGQYLIADQVVTNNGAVTNDLSVYSYNKEKDEFALTVLGIPGMQPFTTSIGRRR